MGQSMSCSGHGIYAWGASNLRFIHLPWPSTQLVRCISWWFSRRWYAVQPCFPSVAFPVPVRVLKTAQENWCDRHDQTQKQKLIPSLCPLSSLKQSQGVGSLQSWTVFQLQHSGASPLKKVSKRLWIVNGIIASLIHWFCGRAGAGRVLLIKWKM